MAQALPGLDSVARSLPGLPAVGTREFLFLSEPHRPSSSARYRASHLNSWPGAWRVPTLGSPVCPPLPTFLRDRAGLLCHPMTLRLSPWLRAHQATRQDRQQCHQPAQKADSSGASSRPCRRVT